MFTLSACALGLLVPTAGPGSFTKPPRRAHVRMAESDDPDWREMRARLVAQAAGQEAPSAGFVYESPLIEQGTILLGGTQQEYGFALRQQFFHKCVLLLLEHNEGFTKGIILNRPSALQLDGWRVWCGHGQVGDGGLFAGADAVKGDLEINCLHALEGTLPDRLSTRVIKGVSYTDLDGAKELVAAGVAQRSDFWVCVGYSGWAPGQLQMEVDERDSWYLAAADSGTLLKQLLRQAGSTTYCDTAHYTSSISAAATFAKSLRPYYHLDYSPCCGRRASCRLPGPPPPWPSPPQGCQPLQPPQPPQQPPQQLQQRLQQRLPSPRLQQLQT